MPITAIFGSELDLTTLELPESYFSYFAHEVKWFESEDEALKWLHNQ